MGRAYHMIAEERQLELEKALYACWEVFKEGLAELRFNIDSMYEGLEKDEMDLVSDQLSVCSSKLLESWMKMKAIHYLEGILEGISE